MQKAQKKPAGEPRAVNVRNPEKYEYAYLLYMQKHTQASICEKVEITPSTFQSWKNSGGWEEKRAARTISVDTLIAKTLRRIDELLDSPDGFNADAFSKAVNQLKTLKAGATVNDKIESFLDFSDFLTDEHGRDPEVDEVFIKKVNRLQDRYILKLMRNE